MTKTIELEIDKIIDEWLMNNYGTQILWTKTKLINHKDYDSILITFEDWDADGEYLDSLLNKYEVLEDE